MNQTIQRFGLLIFFLFCTMPTLTQYQDSEFKANVGAAAYEQRDFQQAIVLWEQVIASGVQQADLYYNIARAYEQLGEWGDARVNDMRAKITNDTVFDMAQRGIEDHDLDAALDRGWARQDLQTLHPLVWIKRTLRDMTRPMGWGLLGALVWFGVWITLIVYIRRRVGRWIMAGFAVGMLLWGGVVAANIILDRVLIDAISFEATPVYSGPGADYALLSTWAEGYDLYIVASKGDWVQVWRADGLSGWIERRLIWEVQHIDPRIY